MRDGLWTKGLVVGIIMLFVGTCFLPSIKGEIDIESNSVLNQSDTSFSVSADDWPMFHHDPSHSGFSTSSGPETNNVLWRFRTSGKIGRSSPAVVNGKVYIGSEDHKIYCLYATNGIKIWDYTAGDVVESSPAVANGKVYFSSWDTKVYCLNADTGAKIWEYTTGGPVQSSPTVVDGKVYIGSNDKKVYCLNADSGGKIWEYITGDYVISYPAVANGKVYINTWNGEIYCLNANTGVKIWAYYTNRDYQWSSPAIADGKVYIGIEWDNLWGDEGKVYCLNAETGIKIWEYITNGSTISCPAIFNNKVYVGTANYGDEGRVYCLNADTGEKIWEYHADTYVYSSPAVADGKVYIGADNLEVACFNADTGAKIWDYSTGYFVWSSPAVADGKVYVGSYGGVYCFGSGEIQPVIEIDQINGGFGISAVITNTGTAAATNLAWSMDVTGSLLFSGGHSGDVIAELAAGASTTIKSKELWGIGPITITVQSGDAVEEATAFLLGPLVLRVSQL